MLLHASSVAFNSEAVLLIGKSGLGKSDLALQLIELGANLISDDQTLLKNESGQLVASPPDNIKGLIEVRYVGLMKLSYKENVPVKLCVELVSDKQKLDRLPKLYETSFINCSLKTIMLPAYEASTAIKIKMILNEEVLNV